MRQHEFIGVSQVARMLGVSRMTVYRMRDDGQLPFVQIQGRYKCKRSDIEKYLQDQRFHPKGKIIQH
jgi:excisionase family DNA binding protein